MRTRPPRPDLSYRKHRLYGQRKLLLTPVMEHSPLQAALWRSLTAARSTARVEDACEAQLDVSDSLSVQSKSFTHRHVDVGGEERSTLSFPQHKHLKSETLHQTAA